MWAKISGSWITGSTLWLALQAVCLVRRWGQLHCLQLQTSAEPREPPATAMCLHSKQDGNYVCRDTVSVMLMGSLTRLQCTVVIPGKE